MEDVRRISDLYLYPIKSCRGVRVKEAVLGPYGLKYDRQWMVIRVDGTILTQRELPQLACVVPQIDSAGLTLSWNFDEAPILIPKNTWETGKRFRIAIQGETVQVIDQGDEVAAWLSRFLKQPVRLVYVPCESLGTQDDPVFASNESLLELNHRLEKPIGMARFRPNVITAGSPKPFEEDTWLEFLVKSPHTSILFRSLKPCQCCLVITRHPGTGERQGMEPLEALSHIHKDGPHALFGMHMNPLGQGTLRINDIIHVTQFGPRPSL